MKKYIKHYDDENDSDLTDIECTSNKSPNTQQLKFLQELDEAADGPEYTWDEYIKILKSWGVNDV